MSEEVSLLVVGRHEVFIHDSVQEIYTGRELYYNTTNRHFLWYARIVWGCVMISCIFVLCELNIIYNNNIYGLIAAPLFVLLSIQTCIWFKYREKAILNEYYTVDETGTAECPQWIMPALIFPCCVYYYEKNISNGTYKRNTCLDVLKSWLCCVPSYYTHGNIRIHRNHL